MSVEPTFDLDEVKWRTRGESLHATKTRKLDDKFRGRKWRIEREVHLPKGEVFRTVFGNKCRHGYIIVDIESGERLVVGNVLLKLIHDRYQGVTLPVRRRGRPPKNQEATSAQ